MKAAVLFKSKQALKVIDVELPKKLAHGQVLVKLSYSGICGAQINEIDAVKGKDKFLPHLLGHEGSGIIEKIGEGVTNVKVGDHVVLHWRKGAGFQSNTPVYKYKGKQINAGWVTTFNEKAIISENRVTKIPKEFSLKLAPLFGCSVTTAFGVVNNDAKIKVGQSVLIIGLGGVGLNIVQACAMVSAYPIIGIDIHKMKIQQAKKFGLTYGFLSKDIDDNKIKKLVGNEKFDIVIETTGIPTLIEKAYELTSSRGKTILVGVPNGKIKINSLPLHFDKLLKGSHGGSCEPNIDIQNYINLINNKKMTLNGIITHEFALKDINKALDLFRTGKAGRILINFRKR
tara:strand:- start:9727 stop:10755 length:1029 start_codon:yes stop_codon:yes gene_type:complete